MRTSGGVFGRTIPAAILATFLLRLWIPSSDLAAGYQNNRAHRVRIGVFGLFHPTHLTLTAITGRALLLQAGSNQIVLEAKFRKLRCDTSTFRSEIAATVRPGHPSIHRIYSLSAATANQWIFSSESPARSRVATMALSNSMPPGLK